jgi:flagellar hook assembly protein FlgD
MTKNNNIKRLLRKHYKQRTETISYNEYLKILVNQLKERHGEQIR